MNIGYSLAAACGRRRRLWSTSIGQFRAHLERGALHDSQHDRLHGVILRGGAPDDAADDRHVDRLEPAAQRVNQQLFGDRAGEHVRPGQQRLPQRRRARRPCVPSASTPAASIASPSLVAVAPLPDGVEVLQREADRIDVAMARAAGRDWRDAVRAARGRSTAGPCARSPRDPARRPAAAAAACSAGSR